MTGHSEGVHYQDRLMKDATEAVEQLQVTLVDAAVASMKDPKRTIICLRKAEEQVKRLKTALAELDGSLKSLP